MKANEIEQLLHRIRVGGTAGLDVEVRVGVGKQVVETLSAMSNSNGGTILVGLSMRDGCVPAPGFNATQAHEKLLARCAQLTPPVEADAEVVALLDGSEILVARIPEALPRDKPCHVTKRGVQGGSFRREGTNNIPLLPQEVAHLVAEQTQPHWDEEPVDTARLDEKLLRPYVQRQQRLRPELFSNGTQAALEQLGVLRGGKPTLGALLTMGVQPQAHFPQLTVTVAVHEGARASDFSDGEVLSGTIPELVRHTVDMVRRRCPDIQPELVQEAVTNALTHRDYSPSARIWPVRVGVFTDRVDITNPGGLYGGITCADLGEPGLTPARNPRLVSFMAPSPAGLNDLAGAHVRATITDFSLTLPRTAAHPRSARKQLRTLIDAHDTVSAAELTAATGLSRSAVQKALAQLVADGELVPLEPGRSPKQRYRRAR